MRRRTRRWRRRSWPRRRADAAAEARIDARARRLVESIRARAGGLGGIEDFLHAYSLSTKEGLALMVLAEALLRVPDAATADRLIEDKLAAGDWSQRPKAPARFWCRPRPGRSASPRASSIRARRRTASSTARQAARPAGGARRDPAGDAAPRLAFRARPDHRGGARRAPASHREFRYSFDMLGEGARTAADAERYFEAYADAIAAIGARAGNARAAGAAGHFGQALGAASALRGGLARARAGRADAARARARARRPSAHDLNFTVDAEEADRLELSLEVIGAVLRRSVAAPAGTASASPCRPIRSAPAR